MVYVVPGCRRGPRHRPHTYLNIGACPTRSPGLLSGQYELGGLGPMSKRLVWAWVLGVSFLGAVSTPSTAAASVGAANSSLQPYTDSITIRPGNGPAGTEVRAHGYVAPSNRPCIGPRNVSIQFVDSAGSVFPLYNFGGGDFDITRNVPLGAALGLGRVRAVVWVFVQYQCGFFEAARAPFTVTSGPGIFGFSPRTGPVGAQVTITGVRFTGTVAVKFNGTASSFSVDSYSQITATVPAGATTGPIEVDVHPSTGSSLLQAISGPDFVVS